MIQYNKIIPYNLKLHLYIVSLSFLLICYYLSHLPTACGDFVYQDFNETTGLIFNGDAGTTSCFDDKERDYGDVQGKADRFNENVIKERGETTDLISESSVETNLEIYNAEIERLQAGFLHRQGTVSAPKGCKVRARMTPSGPSKAGSVWARDKSPVLNGFDTYFTFQISDHSKECILVKDQYFSKLHHRTCSVRGADGFAFVIHLDPSGDKAIGNVGGQMGFGGISNSLAIAFDTWTNPGSDTMLSDHVSVQSLGVLPNDAYQPGLLGLPRAHEIADGKVHMARITYYGELKSEYFDQLVASDSLLNYLKDNGEQKRVGTLVVFLDEGIENDVPIIALPINLSLLLQLQENKAYVGFTSSTGRFYAKHDILSWIWCDQQPCEKPKMDMFDYHQQSEFSTTSKRKFTPGPGFGGGGGRNTNFPIENTSPDTTSMEMPLEYWSSSRDHGLASDAKVQVPPNTLY